MTVAFTGAPDSPLLASDTTGYRPGVCNIGPDEIAKRRRTGHFGAIATLLTLVILVALDVPPVARFLVAIPAAIAASGYLQAYFKFCIAFGSAGVFNFAKRGTTQHVVEAEARARDRRRVVQLSLAVTLIAVAVGLLVVVVPLP